jgi:phenylalanyl-tRNA synthetase beta chain
MKIPFDWLCEFIDYQNLPEDLASEISLKCFEVEEVEYNGAKITGPVLAGKITEINKHPNADKLQIAKVLINESEPVKQIVCGAKNIEIGQIVPVALPNAIVINRTNGLALEIKAGQIRGENSAGMLCSAPELGIESINPEGIYILPENTELGLDLIEKLNLKAKAVLHIESRSNRGDALCLQGIAREASAALNINLQKDFYADLEQSFEKEILNSKLITFPSEIKAEKACNNIKFLHLKNIQIKESPVWLSEKLKLAGISSKNNIIDIINFVMLELGQPMHGYDAKLINFEAGLQVKLANENEVFAGLDGQNYNLNAQNLIIADNQNTLALAGVMGGANTAINDHTNEIILESACFEYWRIRQNSRSNGVISESSRRFERGLHSNLNAIGLMRAANLMKELANAEIIAYSVAQDQALLKHNATEDDLELNLKDYKKYIGSEILPERAIEILEKLGFIVLNSENNILKVKVPFYRLKDVNRPIDLIEELARIEGLNKVEPIPLPGAEKFLSFDEYNNLQNLKNEIMKAGFYENISTSFSEKGKSIFVNPLLANLEAENKQIEMKNPLSKENSALRLSLIPNLLKALALNTRRQKNFIRLFEIGKAYKKADKLDLNNLKENGAVEIDLLGLIISGKGKDLNWQNKENSQIDFYSLKGLIEALCEGRGQIKFSEITPENNYLHPCICAYIELNKRQIGFIGKIHPSLATELEIPENTFVAELFVENLLKEKKVKIKALNDNQIIHRDFTIDLTEQNDYQHQKVENVINKLKLKYIQNLNLLSLYKNNNSGSQTSISYRLSFQAERGQNLLSEEINQQIDLVKSQLQTQIQGISFRDI